MILSPALGDVVTAGSQSCDQKSTVPSYTVPSYTVPSYTVPSYTVPSSLFVKSTVLNPESNILNLVSMVQLYEYSCTAVVKKLANSRVLLWY